VGERQADAIADLGGSWRFISIFAAVLPGQWQRLLEIQEIQIEIMEEISGRPGR
jgi:hypothetical protein